MKGTSPPASVPPATSDGHALVSRIIARDEGALIELIDCYGGKVLGLCRAIVGDQSEAESVMSDVFLELWNRPLAFDSSRGTIQTFLLILARSRSIDRSRIRTAQAKRMEKYMSRESEVLKQEDFETAEVASVRAESKKLVESALLTLPDVQQQALQLAFFSGLTHREVASKLQLPLGTVKSHIRKGLLQLKPKLLGMLEVGEAI